MPMSRRARRFPIATLAGLLLASGTGHPAASAAEPKIGATHAVAENGVVVTDTRFGSLGAVSTNGFDVGSTNGFFTPLGSNGRTCATCHVVEDSYSISPATAKKVALANPADPLFDPVDGGSNCPPEPNQATDARNSGMLLNRALIREHIGVPVNADFSLLHATNPHRCRIAPGSAGLSGKLVLFRRPLPTTNLFFLSDVRWDGRASALPITTGAGFTDMEPLIADLATQANTASIGHELSPPILGSPELRDMVEFERHLFSAQTSLGGLADLGEKGGPEYLASSVAPAFFIGQNDPLADDFSRDVFTLFAAWEQAPSARESAGDGKGLSGLRRAIAAGERIFNSRTFVIANVHGLNSATDDPLYNWADPFAARPIVGTCSGCHNTPNVGNHSTSLMLDIGVASAIPLDNQGQPISAVLNIKSLPVYTLRSTTGSVVRVTDPARALITGRWTDIGKVKVPVLRGLAARAPYFHNGAAKNIADVVEFYDARFNIGLSPEERRALTAFLAAL